MIRLGGDKAMNESARAAEPAPGLDWGEKVVVLVGGILAAMALTVINPILPMLESALAQGPTDAMLVKQLFGVTTLAMVIGAPLGGFLVDRIGMKRLLLAASLVYAVAGTAGLYLSSLPLLLVSRLFLGAATACIQVMSLTLVNTRLDDAGRAKWMGLHVSTAIFCSLLIMPFAGILGDVSWRWPFGLYLIGLIVFFAILLGAGADHGRLRPVAATDEPAAGGPSIWRWMPWHYVLVSLLVGAITFLPTIYLPYQYQEQAGLSPSGIAIAMTAAALVGGITAMLYGRARRAISVHVTFLISFGLAGTGMLIAAFGTNLATVVGGVILYSVGNAWFVPNVMTGLGAKLAPHQQARAAGLVKAGHFLSTPVCVLLVEPYARQYGAVSVMLLAAVMAFGVVALVLLRMAAPGTRSLPAAPTAQAAGH
jgi:MFS family permease